MILSNGPNSLALGCRRQLLPRRFDNRAAPAWRERFQRGGVPLDAVGLGREFC